MGTTDLDNVDHLQGDVRTQQLLSRLKDAEGVMGELLDRGIKVVALHITDTLGLPPLLHVEDCEQIQELARTNEWHINTRARSVFMSWQRVQLTWTPHGLDGTGITA